MSPTKRTKGQTCCWLEYLSEKSLLNPSLHQPAEVSVVFHIQMSRDNGGAERRAKGIQWIIQNIRSRTPRPPYLSYESLSRMTEGR